MSKRPAMDNDKGEVHLLDLGGSWIARTHTGIAATAFIVALGMGWASGNWKKLCTNAVASEWSPAALWRCRLTVGCSRGRAKVQRSVQLTRSVAHRMVPVGVGDASASQAAGILLSVVQQPCWPTNIIDTDNTSVGDHPASRAPFHILIALCAAPRFILLGLLWLSHRSKSYADIELFVGLARTFCWYVYYGVISTKRANRIAEAGCLSRLATTRPFTTSS